MNQADFIATYAPLAGDIADATGLDRSTVLGVIAQETGRGDHVSGNNVFGISPGGRVASYPSVGHAGQAFVDLIKSRYGAATQVSDPAEQAKALVRGGYNTVDPTYAAKVAQHAAAARQAGAGAPSTDDLLSRMRGMAGAAQPPSQADSAPSADELLTKLAQVAPPAPQPAKVPGVFEQTPGAIPPPGSAISGMGGGDAQTQTMVGIGPGGNALVDAAGRVIGETGAGLAEGAAQGSSGQLTAAGQRLGMLPPDGAGSGTVQQNLNAAIWNPLAGAGDLLLRGGNALLRGYQRGVSQAGEEVGAPLLGRDLAALPEVFPTGELPGRVAPPSAPAPAGRNLLLGPEVDRPYLPPAFQDNPLLPGASDRIAARQAPIPGEPVPQSAGAAVSRDQSPASLVDMTPQQVAAYRGTAEGRKLLEPQQPGVPDRTAYVPGVSPTTAEIEQTVNTAREQKASIAADPVVSQQAKDIAAANNDARQRYFESVAGSPVDAENARAARQAQAETDLAATWANKKPADPQPVMDSAAQILASPDGKRPAVRSAVNSVTAELRDADGNLTTDPEQLYGVRKHIDDLLSKEGQRDTPLSARASANLMELKTQLDQVIEQAAPGFRQYLENFSNASRRIDEMEVLQGHEKKLFDAASNMQYSRVQNMMRQIVDSRNAPGLNPYKSISDETMQRLFALRDDLRRSASAQDLARAPGSDTAQNMLDIARSVGAPLVAHGIAAHFAPVVGNFAVEAGRNVLRQAKDARGARKMRTRGLNLLQPQTPLRPMDQP